MVVEEEEKEKKRDFFFNDPATTEIYTLSLHDAFRSRVVVPLTQVVIDGADRLGLVWSKLNHGRYLPPRRATPCS